MVYRKGDCDEFHILSKAIAYLHDLDKNTRSVKKTLTIPE